MLKKLYARWMYAWETKLTTRDTNRIVRPLEWGFDWLEDWIAARNLPIRDAIASGDPSQSHAAMLA
ncbi:MAG: abhydrolase domain-containing 18, partial [Acidobacteriaceae bacterium]